MFLYLYFFLFLSLTIPLQAAIQFHFFLFLNTILYMIFYSKGNLFQNVVLRCGMSVVRLEYKIKERAPLNALLYCSNCKWHLHVLATE
jgi:hypothetical protein